MINTKLRAVFYVVSTFLLTGLVYFIGWNEGSPAMQFSADWLSCVRLELYSCGCLIFFWIAFDFLYTLERWYCVFLKILLIIFGLGLILGFGGVASYIELGLVSNLKKTFPSPWVMPLATCWFLFDALLLSVFRKAAESEWPKIWFLFLPFIVFAISYFVSVGLSYLAIITDISALYVYPQVITGILALVVITQILIIHRNGNNARFFEPNDRYE